MTTKDVQAREVPNAGVSFGVLNVAGVYAAMYLTMLACT